MATVQKVKLSSEMRYLNERLRDGRAVLQAGFSMKRLGNPDPAFQPRVVHIDMDHVKTLDDIYQARGYLDPVVIVHVPGTDRYILVDGFHRHEVYKRAGEDAIPAYVIEGTVEDAMEYSAMANQHAILKRNSEDVKKQVYLLLSLERWSDKSDKAIGEHIGVSNNTVIRHRATYYRDNNLPVPRTYIDSKGRVVSRCRKKEEKPPLHRTRRGQYRALLNGKSVYLGTIYEESQIKLDDLIRRHDERKSVLDPAHFFESWLPHRGVGLEWSCLNSQKYPGLGKSCFGYGRVVITARLNEPSAIYTAIGRLYALRDILERPGDRLVMVCVCYPDDGPEASVEVARRLGVELLTPEELVASIQGDEGAVS